MVVKLPDTLAMCHEPPVEKSLEEMEKLLLLILGAAVQCSHKEDLIGSIKNLPIETQHAFVDKIKEVCDCDLFFIAVCIIFNLTFLLICGVDKVEFRAGYNKTFSYPSKISSFRIKTIIKNGN